MYELISTRSEEDRGASNPKTKGPEDLQVTLVIKINQTEKRREEKKRIHTNSLGN